MNFDVSDFLLPWWDCFYGGEPSWGGKREQKQDLSRKDDFDFFGWVWFGFVLVWFGLGLGWQERAGAGAEQKR